MTTSEKKGLHFATIDHTGLPVFRNDYKLQKKQRMFCETIIFSETYTPEIILNRYDKLLRFDVLSCI